MSKRLVMIKMYLMTNHRMESPISTSSKNGKDAFLLGVPLDLWTFPLLNLLHKS